MVTDRHSSFLFAGLVPYVVLKLNSLCGKVGAANVVLLSVIFDVVHPLLISPHHLPLIYEGFYRAGVIFGSNFSKFPLILRGFGRRAAGSFPGLQRKAPIHSSLIIMINKSNSSEAENATKVNWMIQTKQFYVSV